MYNNLLTVVTKLITKNLKKDLFGLMFKRVQSISIVKAWRGGGLHGISVVKAWESSGHFSSEGVG